MNSKVKSQKAKAAAACGLLFSLFTIHCSLFTILGQSGGPYTMTQSVIAGGGGESSGGIYTAQTGTSGQTVAGAQSTSSTYLIYSGFWQGEPFAPTAAEGSIRGRVLTAAGHGIRNVRLTLTAADGSQRTATTSAFGYYAFDGVETGRTYVIEVVSKKYSFTSPTRILTLQDQATDLDFTAEPN